MKKNFSKFKSGSTIDLRLSLSSSLLPLPFAASRLTLTGRDAGGGGPEEDDGGCGGRFDEVEEF